MNKFQKFYVAIITLLLFVCLAFILVVTIKDQTPKQFFGVKQEQNVELPNDENTDVEIDDETEENEDVESSTTE